MRGGVRLRILGSWGFRGVISYFAVVLVVIEGCEAFIKTVELKSIREAAALESYDQPIWDIQPQLQS